MKKWLLAILFGSVLVLAACGGDDNNGGTDNNAGGNDNGGETASVAEEVYEANCAACHGANLAGGAGPSLEKIGAEYSVEELNEIISNGIEGTSMPGFGDRLSEDEINQLSEWLAAKK
ncbi:c-type cytochrome [Ornithinibacillus halotolerans]|uniref:Cytochrome c domain-containing protein n=1 Tax=Ornithinibacillus halotolerans TaxID=1274357 RepID=A0A916RTV1_9BACI|nr:cytochrome c [Ornithinibacillus halotolerans]GGA67249.1 hypothetical protein GCM10008025_08890 [Ornithinibacillus halotolerans]